MSEPSRSAPKGMLCPTCQVNLVMSERQGIEIDYCPQCRGVWLDRGELDKIIERSAREYSPQPVPDNVGSPGAPFIPQPGSGPWGAASGSPTPPPSHPAGQSYPTGYGSGHGGYDDHGGHGGGSSHGGHGRRGFLGRIFD
ncbi:MAG: zf-TFIIB domain-containing protein [Proteobacteria bacterium]|nr:zf-TFIIB domain-containing protein [Pseudomonadota bacterium]